MVLNTILTRSSGDDASQKDLIFAMLMSTGDGSGTIKADWPKVEEIMKSWGHTFTIGAMCKSSRPDAYTCAFLTFSRFAACASVWPFTPCPSRTID